MFRRCIVMCAFMLIGATAYGQQIQRWSATTGDVSLSGAGTTATIQQPATGANQVVIEQVVVYCSVACTVTQSAYGTAATSTAGSVTPLLPTPVTYMAPFNFFTASNVGAGTQQGAALHVPAGGTVSVCLAVACGNDADTVLGTAGGTAANYSATVGTISGTANITFILQSR